MAFSEKEIRAACNAIEAGLDFALVRPPRQTAFSFLCCAHDGAARLSPRLFFIVPWLGKWAHRRCIADCLSLDEAASMPSSHSQESHRLVLPPRSTRHGEYLVRVKALIQSLQSHGGKTVISRVIDGQADALAAVAVADEYFDAATHAMCALVNIDGELLIIASPETLLRIDSVEGLLFTMALAGTREACTPGPWDRKNIEEQALVTDFIVDSLRSLGLEPSQSLPETCISGNIEHLCTRISARITPQTSVEDILNILAPTPALCGSPRGVSIERIMHIEEHERGFYGGYFGISDDRTTDIFVTLRCASVKGNRYRIYAGGGITPHSDPESEWLETSLKAAPLTSLFKKITNP